MLHTASFFKPQFHVGLVVSIANSEPKEHRGAIKIAPLVPPLQIVKDLHNNRITWDEYVAVYNPFLEENREKIALALASLQAGKEDITLCCWEHTPDNCHRRLAAEYIMRNIPGFSHVVVR